MCLFLVGCGCDGEVEVQVLSDSGQERLTVCAALAQSASARKTGLRGSDGLANHQGLVLVFPAESEVCLVNQGVGFSIDAVLADEQGEVVGLERAIVADDPELRCHPQVLHVLEVAAGVARSVRLGDRLMLAEH